MGTRKGQPDTRDEIMQEMTGTDANSTVGPTPADNNPANTRGGDVVNRNDDLTTVDRKDDTTTGGDANRDPITGAPGSHPVGTGVGAASAGAIGAVVGSVVPGVGNVVGGAVGAVVGAVAGGYAGKAVAEAINPTEEDAYWREAHRGRDYYDASYDYDTDYGPAYRTGVEHYNENPGRSYEDAEEDLRNRWQSRRGASRLDWDRAKLAMRDVYARTRDRTGDGTRATGTSETSESVH